MADENKVRIQDDLYLHVNGEWLENAVIPDDKVTVGGFSQIADEVEETLMKDFKDMAKGNKEIPNKYLEDAVGVYKKGLNTKRRNKEGLKPIEKDLKKIQSLTDINAFNRKLKDLVLDDYPLPLAFGIDTDMKDSSKRNVVVSSPRTILPDTTYYQEGQEQMHDALLGVWSQMVSMLLAHTDLSPEDQALYLQSAIEFDAKISKIVKSQQEWADYIANYNPMSVTKVSRALAPVKFRRLLSKFWEKIPEQVIVYDPRFLKEFKSLFNEETYPLYQRWAYVNFLINNANTLSEELRNIAFIYRRALTGVQAPVSIEKQAYRTTSSLLGEPVGLYYGETYFGAEAKKDVVDIVKEIIATYKKRIQSSDILEPATKEKAILKLNTMVIKMGYPDKVRPYYDTIEVNPRDSFNLAVRKINKARSIYEINRLYTPVDRTEWVMDGHIVNACYDPNKNDITFPAAILHEPFYSLKQTRSQNLGGIGAVIGHEISHAFDNNGALCDENGNLNNWWTKNDLKTFKKKTNLMIDQFDGLDAEGGKANGTLTVSENIADNGGMAVTLDIMSQMEEKNYEEYFIQWAKVWCQKAKPEYTQLLLRVDVHSPHELRANIPPRNFQEWYDTFNVTSSDKMYIPPKKRVVIW